MKNMLNKIKNDIKMHYKEIIIDTIVLGFCMFAALYNFPYLVYKPGGTIPLESRIYIDGEKIELGDYNLAYVAVARGNLITLVSSFFIKNWDIVKENTMTIPNTNYDITFQIEQIDMQNSISIAKYIAYQKAGKNVELENKVALVYGLVDGADTDLQILDEIISYDDIPYSYDGLTNYISNLEVGTRISLLVKNNNKEYIRYANIIFVEGRKIVGVYLYDEYDVKTNPSIEIKTKNSEAGSSGGMMMTLAIYDALMEKDMTGGKKIVGTGTIELDGTIGAIGGEKYKLLGAEKAKADIFFVPKDNYEEAKKVYDDFHLSFDLVSVETFDDVVNYLNGILK